MFAEVDLHRFHRAVQARGAAVVLQRLQAAGVGRRDFAEIALVEGALALPQFSEKKRDYFAAKWIPQGWQWVDPKKEFDAMLTAIRAGLLSRSEAISAFGYDAEDIDREIAADNQRADALGLVFDSDPRHDKAPQPSASGAPRNAAATVAVPQDQQDN